MIHVFLKVRFAKPVLPDQTIQTNMWLEKEERRVYFECRVVETGTQVISGAYVELYNIKSSGAEPSKPATATTGGDLADAQMAADAIFNEINIRMKEKPELGKSINAVFAFQITKGKAVKVFG